MANRERVIELLRKEQKETYDAFEEAIQALQGTIPRKRGRPRKDASADPVHPAAKKAVHWTQTEEGRKRLLVIRREQAKKRKNK